MSKYAPKLGNAALYDLDTIMAAGIDPKTGLPLKMSSSDDSQLFDGIRKVLRIKDEQLAVNRYKWYNLPKGLDGQLIERILYYKGQGAFFYMKTNDTFYFLPYALEGTIDVYGRFNSITPLPWKGPVDGEGKPKPWISGLIKYPVYDVVTDWKPEIVENFCVLLRDYTNQQSEMNISRQILNDPIITMESEAYCYARTNLMANSGITGMRVNDESQAQNVGYAGASIRNNALKGIPYVPIVGNVEFQELSASTPTTDPYLLYMQSLDNFRLSTYGLDEGGIFEKRSGVTPGEAAMGGNVNGIEYQDGLTIRQRFCDIVNSITGLMVWCEPAETIVGDMNNDGIVMDEQDQSGTMEGEQPNV